MFRVVVFTEAQNENMKRAMRAIGEALKSVAVAFTKLVRAVVGLGGPRPVRYFDRLVAGRWRGAMKRQKAQRRFVRVWRLGVVAMFCARLP